MNGAIDLSGPWQIRPDPRDAGLRERWFVRPPSDGWSEIAVPGAWQHTLAEDFHGVAWYRRRVEIPREWLAPGSRLWLRFESVATDCRAWVNAREAGRHVGDYLPFQFELHTGKGGHAEGTTLDLLVRVDEIRATRPPPGVTTENGHITKGFHDVLSLQHGGIWGGVSLRRTARLCARPGGVCVRTGSGQATVVIELEPGHDGGPVRAEIRDRDGMPIAAGEGAIEPGVIETSLSVPLADPQLWSPDSPYLYRLDLTLGESSERHDLPFGVRTVTTGGPHNRNILLNGRPLCIRGVLHWGIEPRHLAPAPPPEQIRAEFTRLRALGFNCVCLCMVYLPEHYYDIADQTGMLLWQEHPMWKSRMETELLPEYRRLLDGFFRRDRRHPSVVIVSGSCEHERIHPDLAAWWWRRAREQLPDRLVQVQSAFLSWTNPEQTDLHDEHVYESSGRWVRFLEDVHQALQELPPRPFVMGETVIGTAWPDTSDDAARLRDALPGTWWRPRGLAECAAFERQIAARHGDESLARFRRHAERTNLLHRKFQSEAFRMYPANAGWVMNQIRDVPQGRLGFMDELDRWRFAPEQTRPWLADCPILLRTPDHRRGFRSGQTLACEVGVANFAAEPFEGTIELRLASEGSERELRTGLLRCPRGDVAFVPLPLEIPPVERPTRVSVRAVAPGLYPNVWEIWALPEPFDAPPGVVRLDGLPPGPREHEPDFEERAYSSGWGLAARSWRPLVQHPESLLFRCPPWRFDAPLPAGTRVVLTHRLTRRLVEFMEGGGRVVLLAGKAPGALGTQFVTLWGQCPLVPEEGPLAPGDSEWVVDLLHHDLARRITRAIPVEDLGIADQVAPIVRLAFTHDRGSPRLFDMAFMAAVGRGLLLATSLDHTEDAGRSLLARFLAFAAADAPPCRASFDPARVRTWAI